MTIDDAILELEELRQIYGGHIQVMLEGALENTEPVRFEMNCLWGKRYVAVLKLNTISPADLKYSTSSPLRRR